MIKRYSFILLLVFFLFSGKTASAGIASPDPFPFTQPDGTLIVIHAFGDETLSWCEDALGNLIVFDERIAGYCYANWTEEGLFSTGNPVGAGLAAPIISRKTQTQKWQIPPAVQKKAEQARNLQNPTALTEGITMADLDSTIASPPLVTPTAQLKRKLLIFFVTWSDRSGINTPKLSGSQIYNLVFNSASNSLNKYYKELIRSTEDIIIPATVNNPYNGAQGIVEVTINGKHPSINMQDSMASGSAILKSAITDACSQNLVNLKDFDTNHDGSLQPSELVIGFIIDGYEASRSGTPDPKFWAMYTSDTPLASLTNGVKIERYFGAGAFHGYSGVTSSDMLTVGTICHEFGHASYKFVDTYDYGTMSGSVTSMGHGYWSLMSYGSWGKKTAAEAMGTTPSYPDAYNLFKYGFVTPGTLDNSENAVLNAPLDIYLLRSATNVNQYFLIQPRKYGTTDNYDRGAFYRIDNSANSSRGGLLIFHVDESVPLVRINDKPGHYRVAIEEAHGGEQKLQQTLNKDYGDLNDLWGPNKKEFSPTSDPSTGLYSAFTYNMLAPSQDTPSGLQLSGITWNSSSGNSAFTMNTTLATISGKIASYNPGVLTTIQLKKNETVAYSTFIQATSGYGQIEQSFSIAGVVPDTYDLTIIKAAHTKFTIKNLIVTSQNLNLTSDKRPEIQLMNLRCGDINGDGIINNDDLIILWNTANYNKISALATNKACDLNGDGVVNNLDLTILWQTYNYNRGEIIIDY